MKKIKTVSVSLEVLLLFIRNFANIAIDAKPGYLVDPLNFGLFRKSYNTDKKINSKKFLF